jgi:glycosyltransferase involved in cell wall biosynthesis
MPQIIVVYDRFHQGHHLEYLHHLAKYISSVSPVNKRFVFVVSGEAATVLSSFQSNSLQIVGIEAEQIKSIEHYSNTYKRGLREIELIEQLVAEPFQHLHFMQADEHAFLLGSAKLKAKNYTISGLLFMPYWRQKLALKGLIGFKRGLMQLKVWRKQWHASYMLSNKNIKHLFICNDSDSATQMNKFHATSTYTYFPDPMQAYPNMGKSTELYEKWGLDSSKKTITLFGALSPRKNIENSLLAYAKLPKTVLESTQFLLAGKPESAAYGKDLKAFLDELNAKNPCLSVLYLPEYFSEAAMREQFALTDLYMACYSNFFYSSGILGHAAVHQAHVLVPEYSLTAQLSEDFALGATANPLSVESICMAMQQLLQEPKGHSKANNYLQSRSPEAFAQTIVNLVGN